MAAGKAIRNVENIWKIWRRYIINTIFGLGVHQMYYKPHWQERYVKMSVLELPARIS